jgi:hypothetical protein
MGHHHQMPWRWLDGAIHQQQVSVMHPPATETMPPHPHGERAQGVGVEQSVGIEAVGRFWASVGNGDGSWLVGQLEWEHGASVENRSSALRGLLAAHPSN